MNICFENLKIDKIISHEVFKPNENNELVNPITSNELTILDMQGIDVLQIRLTEALGKAAKSIQMDIANKDEDSCYQFSMNCINAQNDNSFIEQSKNFARRHTTVHTNKRWSDGLLIIVKASIMSNNYPCVFIIKAEKQTGYGKEKNDNKITLKFLSELFLTLQSKMYKVGVFVYKDDSDVYSFLYDSNMNSSSSQSAARYFYSNFLGLSLPEDSKQHTKKFYEETTKFIQESKLSSIKKIELQQALHVQLKLSNSTTITPSEFAHEYFPKDIINNYLTYLEAKNVPTNSISKDITLIKNKLKYRRLNFSSDVKIVAPSDSFENLVNIESEEGGYTHLKVRGSINTQN